MWHVPVWQTRPVAPRWRVGAVRRSLANRASNARVATVGDVVASGAVRFVRRMTLPASDLKCFAITPVERQPAGRANERGHAGMRPRMGSQDVARLVV